MTYSVHGQSHGTFSEGLIVSGEEAFQAWRVYKSLPALMSLFQTHPIEQASDGMSSKFKQALLIKKNRNFIIWQISEEKYITHVL
jgi:hypothetical protein